MKNKLNKHYKVLIVGGGPSGAATAITLARRGIPALLIDRLPGPSNKPGESLGPNLSPLLQKLDLWRDLDDKIRLPSYGNAFVWGDKNIRERHFLAGTEGDGLHLNRQAFEALLAKKAITAGTCWHWNTALDQIQAQGKQWKVTLKQEANLCELTCDFIVDASGRAATVARLAGNAQIYQLRKLFAAFVMVKSARKAPQQTFVEAVENGWWYLSQVPGQQQVLAFFSSAARLKELQRNQSLAAAISKTKLISRHYAGPESPKFELRDASTRSLDHIHGENWLAVGDAACAYDPISSYGIGSGLGSGFYAGNAVADHLKGNQAALGAYRQVMGRAFVTCVKMIQNMYQKETRFPDSPFWKEAQQSVFDGGMAGRNP